VVACLILNNFNNSWSEDTITANNHPPYPGDVELDTDYVSNDEILYEWIVTEAIVNATANNATAVTMTHENSLGTSNTNDFIHFKRSFFYKKPKTHNILGRYNPRVSIIPYSTTIACMHLSL